MNQFKKSKPFKKSSLVRSILLTSSISLSAWLMTPAAHAQDPAPAPSEAPPTAAAEPAAPVAAPGEPQAVPPAAPAAEAPAAPASPTSNDLADRVTKLEGQLEGISEPFSAVQTDVAALKRLKLSGYLQSRYEWHDDANYGLEGTKRRETNRFFVRRGRLKVTYAGELTEFMLQTDATGDGVVLKDAEASFVLTNENPWMPSATPWDLKLTMGQFKVPFGFEVIQSSGEREMPERVAMVRALYPGERDRGARLQFSYDWFRLMAAVINGNFTTDADHLTFDQTSWKDVVGRVQGDFDWMVIGLSAHHGRFLKTIRQPTAAVPLAGYERYSRLRLGADVQIYADIQSLGGLTLRGETIWARDKQMEFAGVAAPANKCGDAVRFGWAGTLIQNVGEHLGVVVRIDQYNPISSLDSACTDTKVTAPADVDKVTDYGFGLLGYISGNLKLSAIYEHLAEQSGAKPNDNDIFTLQLQAKF